MNRTENDRAEPKNDFLHKAYRVCTYAERFCKFEFKSPNNNISMIRGVKYLNTPVWLSGAHSA